MQKKTKRRITNLESPNRRKLELSRETVRVLGANDTLRKPFDAQTLLRKLGDLLSDSGDVLS